MSARLAISEKEERLVFLHNGRVAIFQLSNQRWDMVSILRAAGGKPVSSEDIIRKMWGHPDREPEAAYKAFRSIIHQLRRMFRPIGADRLIVSESKVGVYWDANALKYVRLTPKNSMTPEQLALFERLKCRTVRAPKRTVVCPNCGHGIRMSSDRKLK